MGKHELQKLHERFRTIADDKEAVGRLADETAEAHPELFELMAWYKGALNGDVVRKIADLYK